MARFSFSKAGILVPLVVLSLVVVLSVRSRADNGICNGANVALPFMDVAGNTFFCQIAASYFSGLTNGTSATTYSPDNSVTRGQMAAFVTRTLDQSLRRGSRRAALNQFWTPAGYEDLLVTAVGDGPGAVISDGADVWVANYYGKSVARVRASDGKLLETWTLPDTPGVLCLGRGNIYVAARESSTATIRLYRIDPRQSAGQASLLVGNLGSTPAGIAFDGHSIWIANSGSGGATGTVAKVSFAPALIQTFNGFNTPRGLLYDGAQIWVTDSGDGTLKKLDGNGNVLLSVPVGNGPFSPLFDGTNIWVPTVNDKVTVVRAATGAVLATLTGNGLNAPIAAAFDGERILVVNSSSSSASLWKATDFTPLGSVLLKPALSQYTGATAVCSDGLNFWITLAVTDQLVRF